MNSHPTVPPFRSLSPALASAVLLIAAFPSFDQPWCAWIALIPWLLMVRALTPRRAFGWSWLVGFLFFLGSIAWLIHVTLAGWIILCAYLALYFGAFGWFACQIQSIASSSKLQAARKGSGARPSLQLQEALGGNLQPGRPGDSKRRVGAACSLIAIPSAWVALEYARSHFLSGFGWNLLAYSQTPWTVMIQLADVTGAWGVSFLIVLVNVLVNAAFAEGIGAWVGGRSAKSARPIRPALAYLAVALAVFLAVIGYGAWQIAQATNLAGESAITRVALVQGNIPQEEKWEESQRESILERYGALTQEAAAKSPSLIVWPETAVPGYLGLDEALTAPVSTLARSLQVPLLVGAPFAKLEHAGWQTTNAAVLIDGKGLIDRHYAKLHLVPFGEFIPGEFLFPWLRALLPPVGDFVPGTDYTVFRLGGSSLQPPAISFSVLICFEDLFPELARRFVREGAQFLIVITNDAWFGPTGAAYQHAQASAFRAVELRVPLVRAANTGWSGCIDAMGRRIGSIRDSSGRELFVSGTHLCEVKPAQFGSLYLRWGDWFAWLCVLASFGFLAAAGFGRRKEHALCRESEGGSR